MLDNVINIKVETLKKFDHLLLVDWLITFLLFEICNMLTIRRGEVIPCARTFLGWMPLKGK